MCSSVWLTSVMEFITFLSTVPSDHLLTCLHDLGYSNSLDYISHFLSQSCFLWLSFSFFFSFSPTTNYNPTRKRWFCGYLMSKNAVTASRKYWFPPLCESFISSWHEDHCCLIELHPFQQCLSFCQHFQDFLCFRSRTCGSKWTPLTTVTNTAWKFFLESAFWFDQFCTCITASYEGSLPLC